MTDLNTPLPPGSVNLEDDAPQTPPAAPLAAAPAAVAAPPEPETDADPRVNGLLQALKAEREKARGFAEKAGRTDALEQELTQARPYVEFLRNNPQVLQPRQEPTPPPDPTADPMALQAAQMLDFYDPQGKPDVARGAQWVAMQRQIAEQAAQAAVGPLQAQTAEQRADVNYGRVLQIKDAAGQAPSKASVDAAWRLMDKKDLADPQVAAVVSVIALGLDRMRPQAPAAPATEPLVTESPGGQPGPVRSLTPLQQRVAAHRGMTSAQFAEQMKGFQPGRPTILEDD